MLFVVKFRRILEVFAWWGLWRKFWAHFHNLCVQKWSCFLRSSDPFQRFSPCEVYNKSSGHIITIFASTNEAVCHEVHTDFGSFLHASFLKKLWAHFHDLCIQKWSCLLLSSDTFWKFSGCKVCRKRYGSIFAVYASKNEVVSCEVQTHFGGFHRARFITKVLGAFSPFLRPQTKLFALKFRLVLIVFSMQALWKSYGRIFSIFASKNEAVCRKVQRDFGSFLCASFTKSS